MDGKGTQTRDLARVRQKHRLFSMKDLGYREKTKALRENLQILREDQKEAEAKTSQ